MPEESDFWRQVRDVAREVIDDALRPTGVRPTTRDGNTIDRYGRVTFAEYRRGASLTFGTTLHIAPGAGGTLIAGTADVQYNDESAFWGTANPSRITFPVGGRYLVVAHVQATPNAGTASVTAQIAITNNTYAPIIEEEGRVSLPAGQPFTFDRTITGLLQCRAGAYAQLVIQTVDQSSAGTIDVFNCTLSVERVG